MRLYLYVAQVVLKWISCVSPRLRETMNDVKVDFTYYGSNGVNFKRGSWVVPL